MDNRDIADATAKELEKSGIQKAGLMKTKYTITKSFYK